ncbi:hypothetical protein EIO_2832 [Ketogulonicigenium vulgare Y25]|nr:hypothetical protein EIO_2832 [Ketogulonicigenium vulgare Y25]
MLQLDQLNIRQDAFALSADWTLARGRVAGQTGRWRAGGLRR